MRRYHNRKMILSLSIIIILAFTSVLPVFAEGRIILDEGLTFNGTMEEIEDYPSTKTPQPAFMISILGGKGFTVVVTNVGEVNATNTTCDVVIEGGLFMTPKEFTASMPDLGIGENITLIGATKGIGLGVVIPIPTITIAVNCTEGITASKAVQATVFFSMVTLL